MDTALVRSKLQKLRLARTLLLYSLVLGAVLAVVGHLLQDSNRVIAVALMVPFGAAVLVALVAFVYLVTHRCPRCAKPFFWSRATGNYFATACLNCGARLDGTNA